MNKGNETKTKIISIAARLFLEKGYNATGINEILAKAQVPKGSFYFHFTNKKELADYVAQYYSSRLEQWFKQTAQGRSWKEFIGALVKDMKSMADQGRHMGCPLGVLGVEVAFSEPEISAQYARSMDRIIAIFSDVMERSGVTAEEAQNLAKRTFFVYQGYLQYYRMTKNIQAFEQLLEDVANAI